MGLERKKFLGVCIQGSVIKMVVPVSVLYIMHYDVAKYDQISGIGCTCISINYSGRMLDPTLQLCYCSLCLPDVLVQLIRHYLILFR